MGNEKDYEVIEQPEVISVPDKIVDEILQMAEKRLQNIKRIKEYALTLTNTQDWYNLGGKPYLCAAGNEKVARVFGVNIQINKREKITGTDQQGEYYIWIYTGISSLANKFDAMDCQGICSSRDKFFATTEQGLMPISEVDEPSIMKKAYNNLVMNGISRILGLRNLTWEEIEKAIGDKSKIKKVDYHSKKAETDPEVNNQKNEIIAKMDRILTEQCGTDEKKKKDILMEITTFANLPKAETIDNLKSFTIGRIKATYVKLRDKFQIKEEPEPKKEEPVPEPETEQSLGDADQKPTEKKSPTKTADIPFEKGGKVGKN